MEIVPIIYKFLIIGGAILALIIIISFLLSKSAGNKQREIVQEKYLMPQPIYLDYNQVQPQFNESKPVIIPINALENKDIQVVRRQSYEELDMSNRATGQKNGNKRYTILNEELKNSNYRYVNEG
jgi:hypothetical protein